MDLETLAQIVDDLYSHADGNVGDGCWELHDKYAALLAANQTIEGGNRG